MRRLFTKVIVTATVVAASLVVSAQPAAAGPPRYQPPDLVALGDSFAAGTGNTPYRDEDCGRSKSAAYSQRLEQLRLVTLQAFPACGGDTTVEVAAQVGAITNETDIVTVQALGNDFYFGMLARLCLAPQEGLSCHRDQQVVPGLTVGQLIESIPAASKPKLDALYGAIVAQIVEVGSRAKVIVVDYGNPFPNPNGRVGPFCPTMDHEELGVARDVARALNAALKERSAEWGFTFANAAPRFRGLDVCGFAPAFFQPPGLPGASDDPVDGALHPNKLGQGIYAAVLAGRLHF
jgi:hypothetical protein